MHSTKRFEPYGHDHEGHWGPVTSTVDWCERNYTVSPYLAEFWNSISNIVIVGVGLFNLHRSYQYRYEPRFAFLSMGVAVVGFGSFAFHGTLQYNSQIADEVPMIYSICIWCYCLYQIESTDSRESKRSLKISQLILILASVGYTFLHIHYALVTAFQLYFGFLVVIGTVLIVRQSILHTDYGFFPFARSLFRHRRLPHHSTLRSAHTASLRSLIFGYFGLLLSGFAVWIIDQHFCTLLYNLPFGLPNPQLHAWWHALTGLSHHYGIQFVIGMRQKFLTKKLPITVWSLGGMWPIMNRAGKLVASNK